jgi:hypothetical protein
MIATMIATRRGVAIWMHPARDARASDYSFEEKSKYEIWQVLGWPYGTSVAMARIVCLGMFDRLPDMKIVTHHLGAMIRISKAEWGHYGISFVLGTSDEDYSGILAVMKAKGASPDQLLPHVLQRYSRRGREIGNSLWARLLRCRSGLVRQ